MSEIYENSYLTLAAALASDDDRGFLPSNSIREKYLDKPVELADLGIEENAICVRRIYNYRTSFNKNVLETRGWTLQETLVPPQLLTFAALVSFEYREASFCEGGNDIALNPFCTRARDFDLAERHTNFSILEHDHPIEEVYRYWNQCIIQDYTRRNLKESKDRLPALSALAYK
ncbi:hypothetical protein ANO14919_011500 [Xylariales sp. No.14919]|nr:hypothetical protein ANO14919_011500 [Xylariales sp. No.14919]